VILTDQLPKTPSGKVRKAELRDKVHVVDLASG
jgi:acyl-coenzyme A synthetase/AMP-(fatty) acid ligase